MEAGSSTPKRLHAPTLSPMLTNWQAVVLGLVEGITEYLPVSSTGHLEIVSDLLKLKSSPEAARAVNTFNIVVQGGAILAVLGLYFPRFVQMLKGLLGRDNAGFKLLVNIVLAFIPAAAVGVVLNKKIEEHLFKPGPVVFAFIVGGVYMLAIDAWRNGRWGFGKHSGPAWNYDRGREIEEITPAQAIMIGCMQIMAMWPGTSRSMMTITGGYFARLKPAAAAEFSFLLGMPTLLAATLFKLYKDYSATKAAGQPAFYDTLGKGPVIIGMAVAAISAAFAVKWLVGFLNRRGLTPFGVYRILLGIALVGLILGHLVTIEPEEQAETPTKPALVQPKR
jgi:undecaprenyl-diphosphatase